MVPTTQYLVDHLLQESEFLCSLISNLSIQWPLSGVQGAEMLA